MLVTEFVQNGDLRKLLDRTPYPRRSPEEEKQWRAKIMQILIDVAKGMLYMHSFTPAIIHRYLVLIPLLLAGAYFKTNTFALKKGFEEPEYIGK